MSHVSISGLSKRFAGSPPTFAVDDLDLEVGEGEFLVLLGASGCGKTTTLRCLAGLETPDEGTIKIGGTVAFDGAQRINQSPDKRFIGMVFQSYALWPHMTIRENIGYPLKSRKLRNELNSGRVEETAELLDLGKLLDRYPAQLSGGQQQRVALARGLVVHPDLVLFDEPLSNLDARLRDQVRAELHELHQRRPFAAVFVTHDQSEALALGQRMAIMRAGRIEQLDNPRVVYERPATEYVAAFIGMSNRLECVYKDGRWWHDDEPLVGAPLQPGFVGSRVVVRIRPEDVRLVDGTDGLAAYEAALPAVVADAEFGGRHFDLMLERVSATDGHRVHARVPIRSGFRGVDELRRGDAVTMALDLRSACFYSAASGEDAGSEAETGQPNVAVAVGAAQ